jgi:hypothetical protein
MSLVDVKSHLIAGKEVIVYCGTKSVTSITNSEGIATISFSMEALDNNNSDLRVIFVGDQEYFPAKVCVKLG